MAARCCKKFHIADRALANRGRATIGFYEAAISTWRHAELTNARGTPKTYSDTAIECALLLKSVIHLNIRVTQGFLSSVIELMELALPVPDYSTVSRRQRPLAISLPAGSMHKTRNVVVDSTGLKIYGAGEWHVKKHDVNADRAGRKLHLGIDELTLLGRALSARGFHNQRTEAFVKCVALNRMSRLGMPNSVREC